MGQRAKSKCLTAVPVQLAQTCPTVCEISIGLEGEMGCGSEGVATVHSFFIFDKKLKEIIS